MKENNLTIEILDTMQQQWNQESSEIKQAWNNDGEAYTDAGFMYYIDHQGKLPGLGFKAEGK